jgi:hypothetical protein
LANHLEAQFDGKGWLRQMSTVNSLPLIQKLNQKTEEWQTGFIDVKEEPTDDVREIMRRNSEAVEEMITNRVRD